MKMPKRDTEEEMLEKVMNMGSGKVENKDDKEAEEEVKGVELEQPSANVMPHVQQETGLKSEKDGKEEVDDSDDDDATGPNEDPDKVVTQGKDSPEDILKASNADKRIKDAQTKMHQKASEASESKILLDEANLKIKSYESVIAKSGANSTEGIQAQQNIDDTNVQTITDLKALEDTYPEISKPIISAFDKMQKQLDSMRQEQAVSTESIQESNEKMLSDMHYKRVGEFHPDYAAISKSQEFTDWVNGLSPFERSAALRVKEDGDADESISMLDKFKEDTGYSGNGNTNTNDNADDNTNNDDKNKANLDLAKSKVSPAFSKKKDLKLKDNKGQLTVAEMRKLAPTKENEDRILLAMATGNLIT
jgi:hypothetical protein